MILKEFKFTEDTDGTVTASYREFDSSGAVTADESAVITFPEGATVHSAYDYVKQQMSEEASSISS